MAAITVSTVFVVLIGLTFVAWRRYLWVVGKAPREQLDSCPYSLTDVFGDNYLVNVPHQEGIQWLTEVFSRSAERFPDLPALQIPHTGESLTFAELDARAEDIAVALAAFLTGPDQVVAVAMSQDNWQIVASHLGILKAGGTMMFLDTGLPEALITHMLEDADPVVILTRGQEQFRNLPTLDVLTVSQMAQRGELPSWMDDPGERLATIFYTSGTTGMPKGVECPHAGYVNLALTYADYFDLTPGMDASSLTSSLGYDGSISEMYSAWVSGCAVVMLTKDQIRSGPDLVPVLREAEVTVLFCPPVLLTTLTSTPELDLSYPICRYIVPAGEAFPGALVEPWTRGRRQIINTYGPTEASTDTSRQTLRPGEPVTIGSPFANVTYVILEMGGLHPLAHGEEGELCIGGVHVARGYRNLPEQTAEKFITHPDFGRLFRTGDRCRIDIRTQRVHFLGRVDAQLKVRGHRVEIQPVEDILQTQFQEIEAAVLDYQNQELVAFVAAPSITRGKISDIAAAPAEWASRVTTTLAEQLPAPSVPTRIFLVERFVMKPTSGKIDRGCLPDLSQLMRTTELVAEDFPDVSPTARWNTEVEKPTLLGSDAPVEPDKEEALAICREVFETPLGWDDVFVDHGGHSILIAELALRLQAAGWAVSVRELLTDCDTARKVAGFPREAPKAPEVSVAATDSGRDQPAERDETGARVLAVGPFTTLQVLFLLLLYSPHLAALLGLVAFAEIGEFFMTARLWEFLAVGFVMYLSALLVPFTNLFWVMVIKLCMGGHLYRNRATPGVYPKWSRMHLRTWCIGRMEGFVLHPLAMIFRSAPLMAYALRCLGATVGENLQCAQDAVLSGPLDLLTIEDDVAIQTGAYVHMSTWSGQDLHVGPVHLRSGCKIGMRAAVGNGVTVGRGSWITPFTPILSDVGSDEMWEGAPARFSGRCVELDRARSASRDSRAPWLLETSNVLMQVCLDFFCVVAPTAMVTWFAVNFIPTGESELASDYFKLTPLHEIVWQMGLYAFTTTWVSMVLVSVLSCVFLRCTSASPGLYSSSGFKAALLLYRVKRLNQIQRLWTWTITGQYLRALAGMRFPRVGASECDLMFNLVPELVSADSQVFWSNGGFTNMLDYGAEHIELRQVDMPTNFFSGNNCVVEAGQFPTNFLLGVSTMGNDIRFRRQMRSRLGEPITVAGNPPVRFASADFEAENEAQTLPSFPLFLGRVFLNDLCSGVVLPIANVVAYGIVFTALLRLGADPIVGALAALVLAEVVLVLSSVAIKKLLVGRWGSDDSTPFWSWRHFTYFFAQDCFFAWCRIPLAISAGTVLSNIVLRWMGCQIGSRTIVSPPLQAADWNAASIGDDCIVHGVLQFHTLENMMLKAKRTEIQDGSTVNLGATVMGGAILESGTTLLPLSLVLKEMHLPWAIYEGSPTEAASLSRQQKSDTLGV